MQQDKKYYDDFFTKYPVDVHDDPERFMFVASLLSGKVLDVACGTGTLADYYSGDYVGVDFSSVAIKKAQEIRRKNATFHCFDFTKRQELMTGGFDSFYLGEFLEHIENDDVVFENILKMGYEGARVIVSVPNGNRVPDESHCRIFTVPQIRRDYSKYGFVQFHDWPGFKKRIVFSILLGVKAHNDVSLVMIVKDEEKGIEKAITSALGLVDRVVVSIDSKTTDKTLEIAKLYADEIREHVWQDDFSKARNEAKENVKTKWILFLDGHEYVEKIGKVREKMKEDVDGIIVDVRLENGMVFKYPRIYRSYLNFENAVHNKLTLKKQIVYPGFVIVHDRLKYQDKKSMESRFKQRDAMLPRIMKEYLKKDKKDTRSLFHLGNFYMMKKQWKLADYYYKQYLKYGINRQELYLVALNRGLALQMQGKLVRALWVVSKADKYLPGRWETARVYGGTLFAMGFYKKSLKWLTQALNGNDKDYLYRPFPPDYVVIWDLIGTCYQKLGQLVEAKIAWEQAIKHAKEEKLKNYFKVKIRVIDLFLGEARKQ